MRRHRSSAKKAEEEDEVETKTKKSTNRARGIGVEAKMSERGGNKKEGEESNLPLKSKLHHLLLMRMS